jgi:Mg-chelatase subunit ChlD
MLLALPFVGRRLSGHTPGFWFGLALRAFVLLGLILGLAGIQVVQAVHETTVVFVVDRSDSVPQAEQKRAEEFIRTALTAMRPGDRAAIVAFGENALVERLASEETTLPPIASVPRTSRTNIGSALHLAMALFPEETHKRIVLLSDGSENAGRAADVLDLAAARGVQVDVVPLHPPAGQAEAYLDTLEAPAAVRQGQTFEIVAVVQNIGAMSSAANQATVRLFGDGKLIATRNVTLQAGSNRIAFSITGDQAGFRRYTAELEAANDTLTQNNTAAAFTVVHGPPRVLVVENAAGDADNLVAALKSAHIETERVAPADLPGDLAALSTYDAVFIVNTPATVLPDAAMNTLPAYVRDLGRGLVMIGGPDSFGAGGYLRTPLEKALPVDMDVRSRTQEPNLALVFVIDKSGSMGRCHCNDPSLQPGQYARVESGLSKVDIAKDAVMQAASLLGRTDYIGVVAFDSNALWALRVQELADPSVIQSKIGGVVAEGQTNIYAGLSEAEAALAKTPARLKHVILLTDGWSRSGDFDPLAIKMQDEGISLSVVAAGSGSALYLEQLARKGGGRYYAAPNMSDVPKLFFKETIEAVGSYIIEQPFYPLPSGTTPILRGLDVMRLPALRGYNGTTPKATAHVSLVSDQGDPILATWQYGLGRSVAWTSDAKGQWAADWVKGNEFNTFIAQMANWVMPQPADEGLQTAITSDGGQTAIEVTSRDPASAGGRPRDFLDTQANIVGPDFVSQTVTLAQVAPGRYRGEVAASQPGTYLVQVTQRDATGNPLAGTTAGLAVPYSPEYKTRDLAGLETLRGLIRATGGQEIADPALSFAPFARPAARTQPVWPALLLIAALLFPLDVAARRLRLTRGDVERLVAWARSPLERRRMAAVAPRPRALSALFAARDRAARDRALGARSRPTQSSTGKSPIESAMQDARSADSLPQEVSSKGQGAQLPPTPLASPEAMAERLKKARDRARRSRSV